MRLWGDLLQGPQVGCRAAERRVNCPYWFSRVNDTEWLRLYNAIFSLINDPDARSYYSGPRYLNVVRQVDPFYPDYTQFIANRKKLRLSTTRKDFFLDTLLAFPETDRFRIVESIIATIEEDHPSETESLRHMMTQHTLKRPDGTAAESDWSEPRLFEYLERIDREIANRSFNTANTLIYTCLEGLLKVFVKRNIEGLGMPSDVKGLAKLACEHIRRESPDYPSEVTALIKMISHAVTETRDAFSDSHYDKLSDRWVAEFLRDCLNSLARLLMSFDKAN